jgi:prepilin-type N-terminal cleavage/methylation domain-containing protein/prepilin-type processing-associated H-X9-DG protein
MPQTQKGFLRSSILIGSSYKNRRAGFSLVELLTVIAIIGLLIQMLLPAIQSAREAARNTACISNVGQLNKAALAFESAQHYFPSSGWGRNWTGDPDRGVGKNQPGGWCYQLLPYIEQQSLYDLGKGESTENKLELNQNRLGTPVNLFICPSRRECKAYPYTPVSVEPANFKMPEKVAKTDFAGNGGDINPEHPNGNQGPKNFAEVDNGLFDKWHDHKEITGVIFQRSQVRMDDISDGYSNTYLIGEKYRDKRDHYQGEKHDPGDNESAFQGHDAETVRYCYDREDCELPPFRDSFVQTMFSHPKPYYAWGSRHPNGFNMSFCDGSVRQVSFDIDFKVHCNLGNRRDGEVIDLTNLE